jgi:hypothetical protein
LLDELRDRISAFIAQHPICVISTRGDTGAWVDVAWHYSDGLEIVCLLPRWSDALYYLEQDPHVMLVILDTQSNALRWLQYRGFAQLVQSLDAGKTLPQLSPNLPVDDRYVAVRITAERIDLIDENRGWGARETLDL